MGDVDAGSRVYVSHTTAAATTSWVTPYIVPGAGTTLTSDDISSLIHFGGDKIGVMWSNQIGQALLLRDPHRRHFGQRLV